jgi:hypothetical protein
MMTAGGDAPAPGPDGEAIVRALLHHAGLSPQEAEIAAIAAGYQQIRRMTGSLYEVPGASDEVPATTFDARWPWNTAHWAGGSSSGSAIWHHRLPPAASGGASSDGRPAQA